MSREEQLRILLEESVDFDAAPIEYNNEEASAYAHGYNSLRDQILEILNSNHIKKNKRILKADVTFPK